MTNMASSPLKVKTAELLSGRWKECIMQWMIPFIQMIATIHNILYTSWYISKNAVYKYLDFGCCALSILGTMPLIRHQSAYTCAHIVRKIRPTVKNNEIYIIHPSCQRQLIDQQCSVDWNILYCTKVFTTIRYNNNKYYKQHFIHNMS